MSLYDLLKVFWENHDPTQGDRQGNDVGSQYRSAVYYDDADDAELIEATARAYAGQLERRRYGAVTTQIAWANDPSRPLTFWLAEDYHQQYLIKNPGGYDCHAHTGIHLPAYEDLAIGR